MKSKNSNAKCQANEKTPILEDRTGCLANFPARYTMAILGFFGVLNVYTMRVNLSVAMVAMVGVPELPEGEQSVCVELIHQPPNTTTIKNIGEFDWDAETQGLIHSAFFYGYVVTQIPGGILAQKYGAKWLFGLGVLITSVFTLLTPIAARWSVWALIAARGIEGLGEGVTFPAMHTLIGRWVPKMERSRLAAFIQIGAPIGTVVSFTFSGILSDSRFTGGWPSVFYVFGTIGCVWFIFWMALVYETPCEHPRITKQELLYIHKDQQEIAITNVDIPWRKLLTSVPLWALVITHFGQNWGFYTLLTELPTYLSNILHFDLKKNGGLSSLPYISKALLSLISSYIADKLRADGRMSITRIRKIMNAIGFVGPALCLLGIVFSGCNSLLIVILLTVALGFNGFAYSGYNVTHIDMSPQLAGMLMGISNGVGNLAGILAPAYVGWMIQNGQTLRNWDIVFVTSAAIYLSTGLIYNIFCNAELQPWGSYEVVTEVVPQKAQ